MAGRGHVAEQHAARESALVEHREAQVLLGIGASVVGPEEARQGGEDVGEVLLEREGQVGEVQLAAVLALLVEPLAEIERLHHHDADAERVQPRRAHQADLDQHAREQLRDEVELLFIRGVFYSE